MRYLIVAEHNANLAYVGIYVRETDICSEWNILKKVPSILEANMWAHFGFCEFSGKHKRDKMHT